MNRAHKQLDVWKESVALATDIYKLTGNFPKSEIYGLVSQMRRAAVSIPSNIAEGAARNSDKEFAQFLNIAGGIKVNDPAIDLAILSAVLSSNLDIPVDRTTCFAGEAGLSGEIRPVARIEQRIREASKMGFSKIIVSKFQKNIGHRDPAIEVIHVGKIENLVKQLFA